MNRRRELALQRVARIGSIAAVDNITQNTKYKDSNTGVRADTIEAALGTFLIRSSEVFDLRGQESHIQGYGESGAGSQGQLSRQMREYINMSLAEESQLANAKSDLERRVAEHINIKKVEEALANDPSAQYQLNRYHRQEEETDFDRLDANRCSGYLLYSYNKKGVHSVLGEISVPVRRTGFANYETVGKGGNAVTAEA